jgi:hypothetical protein
MNVILISGVYRANFNETNSKSGASLWTPLLARITACFKRYKGMEEVRGDRKLQLADMISSSGNGIEILEQAG